VRAIREQIVAAINLVVQIARFPDGSRRITHISEVLGIDLDTTQIITEDIFGLRAVGKKAAVADPAALSPGVDLSSLRLMHTGYVPEFAEELMELGYLDLEVFK